MPFLLSDPLPCNNRVGLVVVVEALLAAAGATVTVDKLLVAVGLAVVDMLLAAVGATVLR